MSSSKPNIASAASPDTPQAEGKMLYDSRMRRSRIIGGLMHWIVLALSVALLVFISYDTFAGIPFLQNESYMTFQFWVCVVFMADFVLELIIDIDRKRYFLTHIFFLLISIPYLNIFQMTGILSDMNAQELYFLRFIPLVRGAYSLSMVVGALSSNRALSIVISYAAILLSIIYFLSLIFYEQEKPVNSDVTEYWDALWWALMNVTTIGCDINPMTVAGQICAVVLAASGMLMLPLFTVYVTSMVKEHNARSQQRSYELEKAFEATALRHDHASKKNDPGHDNNV